MASRAPLENVLPVLMEIRRVSWRRICEENRPPLSCGKAREAIRIPTKQIGNADVFLMTSRGYHSTASSWRCSDTDRTRFWCYRVRGKAYPGHNGGYFNACRRNGGRVPNPSAPVVDSILFLPPNCPTKPRPLREHLTLYVKPGMDPVRALCHLGQGRLKPEKVTQDGWASCRCRRTRPSVRPHTPCRGQLVGQSRGRRRARPCATSATPGVSLCEHARFEMPGFTTVLTRPTNPDGLCLRALFSSSGIPPTVQPVTGRRPKTCGRHHPVQTHTFRAQIHPLHGNVLPPSLARHAA